MIQVLVGLQTVSPSTASAEYAGIMGADTTTWSTETVHRSPWAAPGVFRNLVVLVSSAPGVGKSWAFTLRKGGAGTVLTVTISGTATEGRLTGVDVPVAVGDLVALQAAPTGTPAAPSGVDWSLEFEGSTAGESGYSQPVFSSTGVTRATGVFLSSQAAGTSAADARNVVAAAGTLTRMTAFVNTAPGVSNGFTFYVNKNGVRQDGTGGTVNTACALVGAITSVTVTYSLPLSPGDLVYTEAVVSGTFTTRNWSLGTAFVATTDGQSQVCGGSTSVVTLSTATQYADVPNMTGLISTTEGLRSLSGVSAFAVSGLQVVLQTAPGASKSRLIDLRINAASVGPTVTISDAATTGSDLSGTATIVDGDRWNLRFVPTNLPTATVAHWGLIQSPPVTAVATAQPFVWGPL